MSTNREDKAESGEAKRKEVDDPLEKDSRCEGVCGIPFHEEERRLQKG